MAICGNLRPDELIEYLTNLSGVRRSPSRTRRIDEALDALAAMVWPERLRQGPFEPHK